jgi:alkylation response protein AidB-like acyl-CoA dehydrogenase
MTRHHRRLREEVRTFAEAEIEPRVAGMEKSRKVEIDLARSLAARGWIGVTVDPQYGGMGLGHLAKTIVIEEISRISGAMGAMVQASQLGTAKILHFGSEQQKCRWLPAVSDGRCLPTIAVTERESGGHVLGMTTTAERDGDFYVLNGRKVFVGNSHIGRLQRSVRIPGARRKPGSAAGRARTGNGVVRVQLR